MDLLRFKSVIILLIASHLVWLTDQVGADLDKSNSNVDSKNNGAQELNDDETKGETPFPNLFLYLDNTFHIVSEVINRDEPRVVMSEYYHGPLKSTLVTRTNHVKKESFLSDFARGEIFKYQPYRCDKITTESLQTDHGFEGLKTGKLPTVNSTANSHVLMGVSALWLNAMNMPKYYNKAVIFSALQETMVSYDKWVTFDPYEGRKIEFFFLASTQSSSELNATVTHSLEMIRILNDKSEVIEVINVISYNSTTFTEQQKNMFKIPLGYGCRPKTLVSWQKFSGFMTDNFPRRIDLEISATKYSDNEKSVSTTGLEYAWAPYGFDDDRIVDVRMMSRIKEYAEESKNIKHVIDTVLSVSYRIDLMEGTCEVKSYTDNDIDRIAFSNGLGPLTLDDDFMNNLMSYKANKFVDSIIIDGNQVMDTFESDLYYFTKISEQTAHKQARMIQIFKSISPSSRARLDHAIINVYNEDLTKIIESYQFNVADIELLLESTGDIARVFNVSDCFKVPEHSRWIRVRYPIDVKWGEYLAPHAWYVKQEFGRTLFIQMGLDYLRVPEIEMFNEQTAIVFRALLLDRPPILTTFVDGERSQLRSLADVLSELSHDNYDRPIESDENNHEHDGDENERDKDHEKYLGDLPKLALKLPGKFKDVRITSHLIPTQFEIEQNPLDVASPRDNTDNDVIC